tara:strand:- start:210 stop:911 length:702 start_codon:yes stop_codon:yes gene_type:complete
MFYILDSSDFFSFLTVGLIASHSIASLCFLTVASASQFIAFPSLNSANSNNTVVLVLFFASVVIADTLLCSNYQSTFDFSFYTQFIQVIMLIALGIFFLVSVHYTRIKQILSFEYSLIINLSVLGLVLINVSNDLLTFYIAIELQSLCFYVLATYNKSSSFSTEAGIKYFILGALTSVLLLISFVLIYSAFGSMSFEVIERCFSASHSLLAFFGCMFFSFAMFFKLGAFPFHA